MPLREARQPGRRDGPGVVAMTRPNPAGLRGCRVQLAQAEEKLQAACVILRQSGWPETADELVKQLYVLRVWTGKDGWLDCLEKPAADDVPGGE